MDVLFRKWCMPELVNRSFPPSCWRTSSKCLVNGLFTNMVPVWRGSPVSPLPICGATLPWVGKIHFAPPAKPWLKPLFVGMYNESGSIIFPWVSWRELSRKHREGFFRWVHLSCSHESHYKVSLQGTIMGVIARSHCKEPLQGIARSHCKEPLLQGAIARSHCKEWLLQGVIERSHCKESLQGVIASCKEPSA